MFGLVLELLPSSGAFRTAETSKFGKQPDIYPTSNIFLNKLNLHHPFDNAFSPQLVVEHA